MERRFLSNKASSVEIRADGDSKTIGGYASCYYDGTPGTEYELWDTSYERAVERIAPGAFSKALSRGDDVACLFNHDDSQLLGRTTAGSCKLSADGRGLLYEATPGDTAVARDVITYIRRKEIVGSSFAFMADEERWTETKDANGKWQSIREILSVTLFDVSPCTRPAYTSASVGMRGANLTDEARAALDKHRSSTALTAKLAAINERARVVMGNR